MLKHLKQASIFISIAFVFSFAFLYTDMANAKDTKNPPKAAVSGEKQLDITLKNGKPTIIHFSSDYCRDCKTVKPVITDLEVKYKDKINFMHLDVQSNDPITRVAMKRYKVFGVPYTVFVSANAASEKTVGGAYPAATYKKQTEALLKK